MYRLLSRIAVATVAGGLVLAPIGMLAVPTPVSAQALSAKNAPLLLAGDNNATVDSEVGPQFWKFKTKRGPGSISLSIKYGSMSVMGNPMTTSITLVVTTPSGKVGTSVITSTGQPVHYSFPATFKTGGTYLIEVEPPKNALLRSGGDYTMRVDGDVDFSGSKSVGVSAIAGTYDMELCGGGMQCQLVHFNKNGTVTAADGTMGTWTAFDPDALIYVIKLGNYTYNEKLSPGRGLVSTQSGDLDFKAH